MMRVVVIYEVADTIKVDVLVGTGAMTQRKGASMLVSFPRGDGRYEESGTMVTSDDRGLRAVDYAVCHKLTWQAIETDITA